MSFFIASKICGSCDLLKAAGATANGIPPNYIGYAENTMILADSLKNLQKMVEKAYRKMYGLALNIKKIKFMKILKSILGNKQLIEAESNIECVERHTYVGTSVN